jgi:putative salt-induced outer membrane protein YdiY
MKYLEILVLFFLSITLAVSAVRAEENSWKDEGELSFVETGGNSEVSTFSAKNLLKYRFSDKIEVAWKAAALISKSDGIRSAENYLSELRCDFLFSEQVFAGLSVGWLKDQFSGIDAKYAVGPILGYKVLTGAQNFLKTELGFDYVKEENTNGSESEFFRGLAHGEYEHHFSESNKFLLSLEYLYDFNNEDNYNMNATTAVVTILSEHFSFKTSYTVKYDNEPTPITLDRTDTILGVSLLVSF